jgi:KipI family sensor histidine kinase inhibitor
MLKIKHIEKQSETALSIYFHEGDDLSLEIALLSEYLRERLSGVIDIIPCSLSLFIEFHILKTDAEELVKEIRLHISNFDVSESKAVRQEMLELPIYYHPDVAPDLEELARQKNLSIDEVIKIHSEANYTVNSLGFAPGFAYLSGMDDLLASPRHSSPRKVAKGSLGIADLKTAVYPNESPGGWVIIGNCPLTLFDIDADPNTPFQVGMKVRFKPITREEFLAKGGEL